MGIFDFFKRKKQITPQELRSMMDEVKTDYAFVNEITDKAIKEPQSKALIEKINGVSAIVNETLAHVEKELESLAGPDWWAVAEAKSRDRAGLQRGKESLLAYRKELDEMREALAGTALSAGEEEPAGPTNA